MSESEYRLLFHEHGPDSAPLPMIVTCSRNRPIPKSLMLHIWELMMAFLPAAVLGILFGGWIAVHCPLDSYVEALKATPQPEVRPQLIASLEHSASTLVDVSKDTSEKSSAIELTQMQINSWLEDRFPILKGDWTEWGIRTPRVSITEQSLALGFRLIRSGRDEFWSISLVPKLIDSGYLSLKILDVRMGLIPIPLDQVPLESSGIVHGNEWEFRWTYHPVDHSIIVEPPEVIDTSLFSEVQILSQTLRFNRKTVFMESSSSAPNPKLDTDLPP